MSSSKSNTQPLSLTQVAAESLPPNVEGLITQVAAPPSVNEKSVQSEPNSNVQDEKLKSNSCPRRKNVFKKFIDYVLCLHLCKARSNNKPKKRETKQPHTQEVKIVPKVEIERPILSNELVQQTKPETDQALVEKQKINEAQANSGDFLLGPPTKEYENKKLLVLDLDETLVHSSFKLIDKPDFIVPVEIDNQAYNVYVSKRPGVDEFLEAMGQIYEIVVFTASLAKYADPVLDILDKKKVVQHRLFREACSYYQGCYVKDLSKIGRPLNEVIIIDNSPASYAFHPQNAVPVTSWFNDEHDTELLDLIPYLKTLANARDVVQALEMSTKIKENTSHNSSSPLPLIC